MKLFNIILQSVLLLGALLCLSGGKEGLVFIALLQFPMGCIQLFSAMYRTSQWTKLGGFDTRSLKIYWLLVGLYAVTGFIIFEAVNNGDPDDHSAFLWFFSAWLIAIYYYWYCCVTWLATRSGRQTFMDVMND